MPPPRFTGPFTARGVGHPALHQPQHGAGCTHHCLRSWVSASGLRIPRGGVGAGHYYSVPYNTGRNARPGGDHLANLVWLDCCHLSCNRVQRSTQAIRSRRFTGETADLGRRHPALHRAVGCAGCRLHSEARGRHDPLPCPRYFILPHCARSPILLLCSSSSPFTARMQGWRAARQCRSLRKAS